MRWTPGLVGIMIGCSIVGNLLAYVASRPIPIKSVPFNYAVHILIAATILALIFLLLLKYALQVSPDRQSAMCGLVGGSIGGLCIGGAIVIILLRPIPIENLFTSICIHVSIAAIVLWTALRFVPMIMKSPQAQPPHRD